MEKLFQPVRSHLLFPFLSNLLLSAASVGKIEPVSRSICTTQRIPPAVSTQSLLFPMTGRRKIAVTGSMTHPQTCQIRPQYRWANSQVSRFFMDIGVRYPHRALISAGGCFRKRLPRMIIVIGIRRSMSSIKIQNPMGGFLSAGIGRTACGLFSRIVFRKRLLLRVKLPFFRFVP